MLSFTDDMLKNSAVWLPKFEPYLTTYQLRDYTQVIKYL